jgi:serine/threonine protein kinase
LEDEYILLILTCIFDCVLFNRDIQPCNIIVSGTALEDELWWSDNLDVDGKVLAYLQKCHVTIVDFGFARALSPDDLTTDYGLHKVATESEMKTIQSSPHSNNHSNQISDGDEKICVNDMLHDTSNHNNAKRSRGRSLARKDSALDASQSRKQIRDLSALGTRSYAAPEIISGLKRASSFLSLNSSSHGKDKPGGSHKKVKTRRSLAECVSTFGMVADAFSGE